MYGVGNASVTTGLTRDEVFAACENLQQDGVPLRQITGHGVWVRLGRGSKTTVQKYTSEWLAMQDHDGGAATVSGAMATIQTLIDRLVTQAVLEERERSRLTLEALQEENHHLALSLARATAEAGEYHARLADAEAMLAAEQDRRKEAEGQRNWLSAELNITTEELSEAVRGQSRDRGIMQAAKTLAAQLPGSREV